jgi:anti-anti-sigma regulatory factor
MDKKASAPGTFSVTVDKDGIVRLQEQQKPTAESTAAMTRDFLAAAKERASTKAVVDLTAVSGVPPSGARKNIADMFKKSGLEKIAIFGTSTPIRVVAGFIMKASGLQNVKFFHTEEEAMVWLKEK